MFANFHLTPETMIVLIVVTVIVLSLTSRFPSALWAVLAAALNLVIVPVRMARQWAESLSEWLLQQTKGAFIRSVDVGQDWRGWIVIGAVYYTALLLLIVGAETIMALLAFDTMGYSTAGIVLPPEAATFMAASLVGLVVVFGSITLDVVGVTRVTTWHHQSTPLRGGVGVLGLAGLLACFWVGAELGLWRGILVALNNATGLTATLTEYLPPETMTWDPAASGQIPVPPVSTVPAVEASQSLPLTPYYQRLQWELPIRLGGVLGLLTMVAVWLAHPSLIQALAVVVGIVLLGGFIPVHIAAFALAVIHEMLKAACIFAEDLLTLLHLGSRSVWDWNANVVVGGERPLLSATPDPGFDEAVARIVAEAEAQATQLDKELMPPHLLHSPNGAADDVPPWAL